MACASVLRKPTPVARRFPYRFCSPTYAAVLSSVGVTAEWLLVTDVGPEVPPAQVGRWYAWRWRIESFFELLKGHGQQVEAWQQETGAAIAKRL